MKSDRAAGRATAGQPEGVLLLDKPSGITSSTAVQSVRRLFGRIKAGHTGTLDPMATGLLPVCLGEATKFAGGLLDAGKTYEAVIGLGAATDTGDAEGVVIFRGRTQGVLEHIAPTLARFTGEIEQLPPMFSALKHRGRPLYEYARAGEEVPRQPRRVMIEELTTLSMSDEEIRIRVRCSKGTYIRTLAHDIGQQLGCGAHLKALRRTGIGTLQIGDAVSWDALQSASQAQRLSWLWPADILLARLPAVRLDPVGAAAVLQGRSAMLAQTVSEGGVRLYDAEGTFLGLGSADANGLIIPKRMRSQDLVGSAANFCQPLT